MVAGRSTRSLERINASTARTRTVEPKANHCLEGYAACRAILNFYACSCGDLRTVIHRRCWSWGVGLRGGGNLVWNPLCPKREDIDRSL